MVGLVVPSGNPKYVNGIVPIEQQKIEAMTLLCSKLMLMGIEVDL